MTWLTLKIKQSSIRLRFPLLLLLFLFFANCAKQGFPPGGPVDKEPPQILASFPANGKINTPLDTEIEIIFNEAINPKTVINSLYFSPPFEIEPKIKIKSDRIIIRPQAPLDSNKTYLFTLGTDLKDAHNVKLDQAFSLAFSTGNSIDSGSISGITYNNGKVADGVTVLLFENMPDSSQTIDSLIPNYITQTGKDGKYAFDYIAPGEYFLVAFEDKNKNRKINIDNEAIGLPSSATNLDSKAITANNINVRLHKSDASKLYIKSCSVNLDRVGRVKFSQGLTQSKADLLFSSMRISDDSGRAGDNISLYWASSLYPASEFLFSLKTVTAGVEYGIQFDQSVIYPTIDDSLKIISSSFIYKEAIDIKPPRLLYQIPSITNEAIFNPGSEWQFYFSEPINFDLLKSGAFITNEANDTLGVELSVTTPITISLKPEQLQSGNKYRLIINPANLVDLAGNKSTDSSITFSFATIGTDTLGSISGIIITTDSTFSHPTIIEFKPVKQGEGRAESLRLERGQVQFSTALFPGYYTISAWVDRNENQQYDFGTIIPYQRSEPFTVHVDTFRVRTRFESAGVEIKF